MASRQAIIDTYQLTLIDDSILHQMIETIRVALNADSSTLTVYGDDTAYIITDSTDDFFQHLKINTFKVKDSIGIKSIEMQRPLYIEDTTDDRRSNNSVYIAGEYQIGSVAFYPLLHKESGEMIATVSSLFRNKRVFTDHEKNTFQHLGSVINQVFQSGQLKKQENPTKHLDIHNVHNFNLNISKTHQFGHDTTVYERILQHLCRLTGAKIGMIVDATINEEANFDFFVHNLFADKSYTSLKNINSTKRYKIKTLDSRFINDMESRRNVVLNLLDDDYQEELKCFFLNDDISINSCLGIPILSRNELLGFVALFDAHDDFHEQFINDLSPITMTLTSIMLHEHFSFVNKNYHDDIILASKQDSLTSLPNIAGGINYLDKIVGEEKSEFTLCFIDIDKFTFINNVYGRTIGDNALMSVAHRLNNAMRKEDFIARAGGDMFMLVLDGHQDRETIERIQERISQPIIIGMESISLNASVAVLHGPAPILTGERHFSYLIETLSIAKKFNRIEFANIENNTNRDHDMNFIHDLNYAVSQHQIDLYGLPAINIETGKIMCIEVLSRWNHPEKGLLSPMYFMPYIENDTESLSSFDYAIIMKTVQFLLDAKRKNKKMPMVCINISPALLEDEKIDDLIEYFTHDITNDIISSICLEVIEWNRNGNNIILAKKLTELRELGILIALDDFGTGYSNVDRLKILPIDIVKIDRSFMHNLEDNTDNQLIIKSLINIAKQQKKEIIVEGVETKAQVDLILEMGCVNAQGFYFQQPTPLKDFLG